MDTLALYTQLRRQIGHIKAQADRMAIKAAAGTINASDVHDGIRTNGFEVWYTRVSIFWDASDPAVDLTAQDYGFSVARLALWGVDPAAVQTSMTERDRAKLIGFWRADRKDAAFAPAPALGQLSASMIAARNHVIANFPASLDSAYRVDADGTLQPKVLAAEMAGLQALLEDVSTKCAALLPV